MLKAKLPKLVQVLENNVTLKEVYRYSYDYMRDASEKSVDVQTALVMLQLVLGSRSAHVGRFVHFVTHHQPRLRCINRDQWTSFVEFCLTIKHDYDNYDELQACNVFFFFFFFLVGWFGIQSFLVQGLFSLTRL